MIEHTRYKGNSIGAAIRVFENSWVECWNCGGEGVSGHDCMDDCCPCFEPEGNVVCDVCKGCGGWQKTS